MVRHYIGKAKGTSAPPPKAEGLEIALAVAGSATALALVGLLHGIFMETAGLPLLMAPFGASAVLVFGAFKSPLAQPRNVIGGHVLSALTGVTVYQLASGGGEMLCISLAVPLAIGLMHMTGTLHPPGGATAFITVAGGESIHAMGYWYILTPCLAGSMLMALVGIIINNMSPKHRYPVFW